jgi:hypothetical protein
MHNKASALWGLAKGLSVSSRRAEVALAGMHEARSGALAPRRVIELTKWSGSQPRPTASALWEVLQRGCREDRAQEGLHTWGHRRMSSAPGQ